MTDLSITIYQRGDGYRALVSYEQEFISCNLPIYKSDLHSTLKMISTTLSRIIENTHEKYYQNEVNIPDNICEDDLNELAQLGILEYIFQGVGNKSSGRELIADLKEFSRMGNRSITIMAENFWVPWQLVYDGQLDGKVDRNGFWGFKHTIDFMPIVDTETRRRVKIDSSDLNLSFNLHRGLDEKLILGQKSFFDEVKQNNPNFTYKTVTKEQKVISAFKNRNFKDSIVYFFCHAQSPQDMDATPEDILLRLNTNGEDLTLHRLITRAAGTTFSSKPLVFINACESTFMSPVFYNGFVPYFLTKGSGGILGTLTKIPGIFASEFAINFFKQFFAGESVTDIMPSVRRKFLEEHKNILGLCYQSFRNCKLQSWESRI